MTRYPSELRVGNSGLEGEDYEPYELSSPYCANPECEFRATDRHHLFSRGLMGGAFDWVRLADGVETGNIIGFCWECHKKVTENKVHINLNPKDYNFYWNDKLLRYQPPKKGEDAALLASPQGEVGAAADVRPVCETCKRPLPRPKIKNPLESKKERKTWSVAIPVTELENGADVIDGLIESARDKMEIYGLEWGPGQNTIYYALSTALALFVTHSDRMMDNGSENQQT